MRRPKTETNKKVRFSSAEDDVIRPHEQESFYPENGHHKSSNDGSIWYDAEELIQFRVRDQRIIGILRKKQGDKHLVDLLLSKQQDCVRGLECYTKPTSSNLSLNEIRQNRRNTSLAAVMTIQQQTKTKEEKERIIARMYHLACGMAKKDAELLAAQDEDYVLTEKKHKAFRPRLLNRQCGSRPLQQTCCFTQSLLI